MTATAPPLGLDSHGVGVEGAGIVQRFALGRVLAGHLDIAAQRQQTDLVIGIAVLDAKEPRPEAHGERLNADTAQLGHGKMAEFMNHNHHADQDDEGDDGNYNFVEILHRLSEKSFGGSLPGYLNLRYAN